MSPAGVLPEGLGLGAQGLRGKEAFPDGEAGYDDGGWEDAMQLLGAAAPELGTRLDAWAGIAAGECQP